VPVCDFSEMMCAFSEVAIRPLTKERERGSRRMELNENAFNQLLAKYQEKVLHLCYAMLGNRALAEETAQDVFIKIWPSTHPQRTRAANRCAALGSRTP